MKWLYRSPFGRVLSLVARCVAATQRPFMVYGHKDPATGAFRKYSRMSSTVTVMNPSGLDLGEDVWVWHYSILDATEGISIGEGCQIGAWVGIFTHGSENSIRLLGRQFVHIPNSQRAGYSRGAVKLGAYTFVGAGSVILPGVTIGKGCLIGTGTLVARDLPDYAVCVGWPGEVKGSTLDLDRRKFAKQDYSATYFDREALLEIKSRIRMSE